MAGRTAKTATAVKSGACKSSKTTAGARKKAPAKAASTKTAGTKAKKAPAQKSPVKKAPAKTGATRARMTRAKPAAKASTAKKTTASKTAANKPAAKKPAVKKVSARKPAAKKTGGNALKRAEAAAKRVKKVAPKKLSALDAKLLSELDDLARVIRDAKREIAAIRPDDVKEEYLPTAADELDAVVEATADATNTIMDACEVVEGVMGEVAAEVSNKLMDATTRIYEACTFQDITGQRITKVVTAMKHIEERIDVLLAAFGGTAKSRKKAPTPKKKDQNAPLTDADLLEGPQLGENAKSQAEIDDLLASFD